MNKQDVISNQKQREEERKQQNYLRGEGAAAFADFVTHMMTHEKDITEEDAQIVIKLIDNLFQQFVAEQKWLQ